MTTTFEDNTEVTLADLNRIAIDLGDTDFSAFSTEKFGVDKLNQITADLVSSGVLRTSGKIGMGCEVLTLGSKAYVDSGVIVFSSGAKMRITDPVEIALVSGTYIYALNDPTTGKASLEVSEAVPSGDYVLLAEVDADGVIADRRNACVAKVSLTADTPNTYKTVTVTLKNVTKDNRVFTFDMGTNAYRYICLLGGTLNSSDGEEYDIIFRDENSRPFLSEDGVANDVNAYIDYSSRSYRLTRKGQYQEIQVIGGIVSSGTHTLKLLVI